MTERPTVNLTLNFKTSKEALDFAQKEADRLHQLITNGVEVAWAKEKLADLHRMIFAPNPDILQKEIESRLATAEE